MPDGHLATELDKMPSTGAPTSGAYGEQSDLERLKSSLPATGSPMPATNGQPSPMPPAQAGALPQAVGRPAGPTTPPGIPSVLAMPTQQPDVPVHTSLAMPGPVGPTAAQTLTAAQDRLRKLDVLRQSPDVSEATREFAQMLFDALAQSQNG